MEPKSVEATGSAITATWQQQSRGGRGRVPFAGRHRELEMGMDSLLVVARTPPPSIPLCVAHSQLPDGNVNGTYSWPRAVMNLP
jgi:hypothetical protein